MITIYQATSADLGTLAQLFDAYRQFYGQSGNLDGAYAFLQERLARAESVLLLARANEQAVGFCQLYPSFTSVGMERIFILNDLFVSKQARRQRIASQLLKAAAEFAQQAGAVRLTLSTAHTNTTAQAVYVNNGWVKDDQFQVYQLPL